MTIAAAIFLIAVGAILRYATNIHVQGVSVDTVGLILSFFQEAIWSDRRRRRDALIEEERAARPVAREELPPREAPPRY